MNPSKITIELLESTDAEGVKNRMESLLEDSGFQVLDVRLDPVADPALQQVYKRLLTLHHRALLNHGPGVAQGVALAIREAIDVMPELEALQAVQEWAEETP